MEFIIALVLLFVAAAIVVGIVILLKHRSRARAQASQDNLFATTNFIHTGDWEPFSSQLFTKEQIKQMFNPTRTIARDVEEQITEMVKHQQEEDLAAQQQIVEMLKRQQKEELATQQQLAKMLKTWQEEALVEQHHFAEMLSSKCINSAWTFEKRTCPNCGLVSSTIFSVCYFCGAELEPTGLKGLKIRLMRTVRSFWRRLW